MSQTTTNRSAWYACPTCGHAKVSKPDRKNRLRCPQCGEWMRATGSPFPPATPEEGRAQARAAHRS